MWLSGRRKVVQMDSERFFANTACPYFPCHRGVQEGEFSCLFCYCPLYALGKRCGGNFRYTQRGIKDCSGCTFPHLRENYSRVIARFPEILNVMHCADEKNMSGINDTPAQDT
jgi:Zn-finger protein